MRKDYSQQLERIVLGVDPYDKNAVFQLEKIKATRNANLSNWFRDPEFREIVTGELEALQGCSACISPRRVGAFYPCNNRRVCPLCYAKDGVVPQLLKLSEELGPTREIVGFVDSELLSRFAVEDRWGTVCAVDNPWEKVCVAGDVIRATHHKLIQTGAWGHKSVTQLIWRGNPWRLEVRTIAVIERLPSNKEFSKTHNMMLTPAKPTGLLKQAGKHFYLPSEWGEFTSNQLVEILRGVGTSRMISAKTHRQPRWANKEKSK